MGTAHRRQILLTGLSLAAATSSGAAFSGDRVEADLRTASLALEGERTSAKAAGLPLGPADVPHRPAAAEQDAAGLYAELERLRRPLDTIQRVARGGSKAERSACREALDGQWGPLLTLAQQIAARPRYAFDPHWERLPHIEFRPASAMRLAVRLLCAEGVLAGGAGRGEAGFALLTAASQVVRHVLGEPTLVALMIATALAELIGDAFHHMLRAGAGDPSALAAARKTHPGLAIVIDLEHHFRGEILFGIAAARQPKAIDPPELDIRTDKEKRLDRRLARYPEALLAAAFEARLLAYYRRVLNIVRQKQSGPLARHRAFKAVADQELVRTGPSYRVSRAVADLGGVYGLTGLRCLAIERLRAASLSLLEHRDRAGSFPDALPEPAADPFDGEPLRYKRTSDGFRLYSIGMNFKDDGGSDAILDGSRLDLVVAFP